MRIFFSLIVFSFMLATCQAACFIKAFERHFINGKDVQQDKCVDHYDGKEYPIGSKWNTDGCLECRCIKEGMSCCHRYGGIAKMEGCKSVINPKTCKYEFYRLDDPSKRCDV